MRRIFSHIILRLFPRQSMREEILERVMRLASYYRIDSGDYLEFGVDQGKSFIAAYHAAQKFGLSSMRFYAFDSFEGLPEAAGLDAAGGQFKKGDYACTEARFRRNLTKKRVDLKKIIIVPGWYDRVLNQETKKKLPLAAAAVVWIDCDLYESAVPALAFATDYIRDGTIILFDDWFCFRGSPERGERRAFQEWLGRNPDITATEYYKFGFFGNSFILHRA